LAPALAQQINTKLGNTSLANAIVASANGGKIRVKTVQGGGDVSLEVIGASIDTDKPSDGTYAIVRHGFNALSLDFGTSKTLSGIAIYNGYGGRTDGAYALKNGVQTLARWTINSLAPSTAANDGVDSFWLAFTAPITTTRLDIDFFASSSNAFSTASFREIQVFENASVPKIQLPDEIGNLYFTEKSSVRLVAHQIESGSDTTSNHDVTSGVGGTLVPYTATSTTGVPIAGYGLDNLNDGDVNSTSVPLGFPKHRETISKLDTTSQTQPLPDLGTIVRTIAVPYTQYGIITDVNVRLKLNHEYFSDLDATLTSPDGTQVKLFQGIGSGRISPPGRLFSGTLDDEGTNGPIATYLPSPNYVGSFQPTQTLAAYDGKSAVGNWTLTVKDVAAQDAGIWDVFGLDFTTVTGIYDNGITTTALTNSKLISNLADSSGPFGITVNPVVTSSYSSVPISDLDRDGFDDFAITSPGALDIYKGSVNATDLFSQSAVSSHSFFGWVDVAGIFFSVSDDGSTGRELWKSDGTEAGTMRVKDIFSGIGSSFPSNLTNVNGRLYFSARGKTSEGIDSGYELWTSDGTLAGTTRVKDIYSGIGSSKPSNLTNVNGKLYFSARGKTSEGIDSGYELWTSDGTEIGTYRVNDIYSEIGSSNPTSLTNVNGTLFFTANDGLTGIELWKSNGTLAGTMPVKDILSGIGGSNPSNLTNVNGKLYFNARGKTSEGIDSGYELWTSDGTLAGTTRVKDIYSGIGGSNPSNLTNVNGKLYFNARGRTSEGIDSGYELWTSAGTDLGTMMVMDINPGYSSSFPSNLREVNGILYFSADDGLIGQEFWKFEPFGNPSLVKDLNNISTFGSPGSSIPKDFTRVGALLYFTATIGTDQFLVRSDGTVSGTFPVDRVDVYGGITAMGNKILYNKGNKLFRFDSGDLTATSFIHIVGQNPIATSGDFNGDGDMDLAVWQQGAASNFVNIFYSAAKRAVNLGGTLDLKQADVVLPFASDSNLSTTNISLTSADLNGDRINDLVISDGLATSQTASKNAGRLYVVYGAHSRTALPTTGITDLENFSVPGSGSFVVDQATGRPDVFSAAGDPYATSGTVTGANNVINTPILITTTTTASLITGQQVALSGIGGTTNANGTYFVKVISPTTFELYTDALLQIARTGNANYTGGGTWQYTDKWFRFSTLGDGKVGDYVRLVDQIINEDPAIAGPLADLIDASGGVIAKNQSAFDLRTVPAGTYYLKLHDILGPFQIEFKAPPAGQSHGTTALPDRDRIDGGDGDDTLVGNNDIDRIFGGSGADTIIGEPIEQRDSSPGESNSGGVNPTETISQSQSSALDTVVQLPNTALGQAIALKLGHPVMTSSTGGSLIHGPIFASELNSITALDAKGLGLTSLDGIDYLTQLQILDLSGNSLSDSSLSELSGLKHLESLDLTNNATVTDISPLGTLTSLRQLFLEGIGFPFNPSPVTEVEPNDTRATAQNLENSSWSKASNPNIDQSTTIPHITIVGTGNNGTTGTYDYFRFTATAGSKALFDIDAHNFDTELFLFDSNGTLLAENDDSQSASFNNAAHPPVDPGDGTQNNLDSYIEYTFASTGTFVIGVGKYQSSSASGQITGDAPNAGNAYILHVSVVNHPVVFVDATTIAKLSNLQTLTLPIPGLSASGQNMTSLEGRTVNLTTATSGAWSVLKPDLSTLASGTGTTISFIPSGSGVYTITHDYTGSFPFFSQNVAPVISVTPQTVPLNEGDSKTAAELLAGMTIVDPGTPPTRQVTVTDPAGITTDLTIGSLKMSNDVVKLDPAILDGASDVSVAFWLKTGGSGIQTIVSAANQVSTSADNDNEFEIRIIDSNTVRVYTGENTNSSVDVITTNAINNNIWHHFVVVRNDTADAISVYVDGLLQQAAKPTLLNKLRVDFNGLVLGQEQDSVGGGFEAAQALSGDLDELAIFRRALTADQIKQIFSMGVIGNEADLAAYFPLNELGGEVAYDRSSNARNGLVSSVDATTPISFTTASSIAAKNFNAIDEGDYRLRVIAYDPQGASDRAETTISVANVAPTAKITATPAVTVGQPINLIAGQVVKLDALASTDPGVLDTLSYEWTVTTENLQFIPSATTSTFEFTPPVAGRYTITLKVTDSFGQTSTVATQIVNVNPSVQAIPARSGFEGDVLTFEAPVTSNLAANATRNYTWTAKNASNDIIEKGTNATFAFVTPDNGNYTVELRIADNFYPYASINEVEPSPNDGQLIDNANWNLGANASIPTATAIPHISILGTTDLSDTFKFSATAGDRVILRLQSDFGTGGGFDLRDASNVFIGGGATTGNSTIDVKLATSGIFSLIVYSFGLPKPYIIDVSVANHDLDAGPYFSTTSTTVTVANRSPKIDFGATTFANEGALVTINPIVSDPGSADRASLVYAWAVKDKNNNTVASTPANGGKQVTFTPGDSSVGPYTVTLTVTDKDGVATTATTTVVVSSVLPVVNAGPDQGVNPIINEGDNGNLISFTGSFTDPAGNLDQPFTYVWDFGDGTTATGTRTTAGNLPITTHVYADSGVYNVTLTVMDKDALAGVGGVDSMVVTITNLAPQLSLTGPDTSPEDTSVTFTGSVTDFNGYTVDPNDTEPLRGKIDFGDGVVLPLLLNNTFSVIAEVEPNDTLGTAQNLENSSWSRYNNPNIDQSITIPHISIVGTGNNGTIGTFDYYRYVATAGSRALFDIDDSNFAHSLSIYDSSGSSINSGLADFSHTFATSGTYYVRVGKWDSAGSLTKPLETGESYTLHVSLENHAFAVGGPTSMYRFASSHVYATPGSYSVSITVQDDDGGVKTFPAAETLQTIQISDTTAPTLSADPVFPNPRKALSKRACDRYSTAHDMAVDLREFLKEASSIRSTDSGRTAMPCDLSATPNSGTSSKKDSSNSVPFSPNSGVLPIKIIPRGLRSFGEGDAEFFLQLLPGPRDRHGLPDCLSFWKTRIEQKDAETFSVGLIFGPSGSGKSSLVKAGLLPILAGQVIPIYIEATAEETEVRLLDRLRSKIPGLPLRLDLAKSIAFIRQSNCLAADQKVLIVIDQFEQWLHAKKLEVNTELHDALRQCNGSCVQCIVMVRDDFWLAVSRFMRDLEVELVSGKNTALVDLFDIDHARRVLRLYGQAFGRLPENTLAISRENQKFLKKAIADLAQEGKVACVRLSLFAEMMKGKEWISTTLQHAGGIEGMGATFLEETFVAPTANPAHRFHHQAARAVLKALLPEAGVDIKGQMHSYSALLAASGYASKPNDFESLIRVLDSELRLITPSVIEAMEGISELSKPSSARYYQLAHDYLVSPVREWLYRKQKETYQGRAELLIADRAALWNAYTEQRQLPSLIQWFQIQLWTQRRFWTQTQQQMMRAATRHHAMRSVSLALALLLICFVGWNSYGRLKARHLQDRVLESTTSDLPQIVKELAPYRRWLNPFLTQSLVKAQTDRDVRKQLHASLALLPVDSTQVDYLCLQMLQAEPQDLMVVRDALSNHKGDLITPLWSLLENPRIDEVQRLRAACALSSFAPDDPRWEKVGNDVASILVLQKPFNVAQWTAALKSVDHWLIPSLADFLADETRRPDQRALISTIYASCAAEHPSFFDLLETRLMESGVTEVIPPGNEEALVTTPDGVRTLVRPEHDASLLEKAEVALARKRANIGVALISMGRGEKVWPLLQLSPDPTLRSLLIDRMALGGVNAKDLLAEFDRWETGDQSHDVDDQANSIRRALVQSLGNFEADQISNSQRNELFPKCVSILRDDPDPGMHSSAEWLLRKWATVDQIDQMEKPLMTGKVEGHRRWYINRQGQTMAIIGDGGVIELGSGHAFALRHKRRIVRNYAISTKEVSRAQFLAFRPEYLGEKRYAPALDCPANAISWHAAAEYCNWLSKEDGITEDQWCYEPDADGTMKNATNFFQRTGYRLPTEAEWEFACRAQSRTKWSWGNDEALQQRYAAYATTTQPGGSNLPNDFGIFDMHGNLWEWCQDPYQEYPRDAADNILNDDENLQIPRSTPGFREDAGHVMRINRGGSFADGIGVYANSDFRGGGLMTDQFVAFGFRVARTIKL
jgi:eukaryotic-like serine/threonine-protein kinase